MDWIPVILALGVLGVVGLIFGILLEVADKKLAVEVDPRIAKVGEALGGANCGACGYAGCSALAEAIVSGEAKPNACPAANMAAISEALGITVEEGEKMVARVICQGHNGVAKERYKYDGYTSCATAASMAGGPKECAYACIGLGDCMRVCSFGAISMNNGIASIDPNVCVACGNCERACPRSAIRIIPAETKVLVLCRNKDIGRVARAACMKACIGCGRCVKECKYGAIAVEDGYARIDPEKCTRCGACAKVCPCGCIIDYSVTAEDKAE